MAVPKFVRGIGIDLALKALNRVLSNFYEQLRDKDLASRINQYRIQDRTLGIDGSIGELAQSYGLKKGLDGYIKYFGDKLAYASHLTNSLNPSSSEVNLYATVQKAYNLLPLRFPKLIKSAYISDIGGYSNKIGNIAHKLEMFYDLVKDLGNKKFRILYDMTAEWLIKQIREQKGMPILGLEHILLKPIQPKVKDIQVKGVKDYADLIGTQKPVYASDIYASDIVSDVPITYASL